MALLPIPGVDRKIQGRWLGLSPQRRLMCDLVHYAKGIPTIPSQRRMRLADVAAARRDSLPHVSWCAIFIKAYAMVSARRPDLRRTYLPLPWAHLYEHPINVASFSVERMFGDEPGVMFAQVPRPEELSLRELDQLVRSHQSAPIESIPAFVRSLRLGRLPTPLRRLAWWAGLYADGPCRAHFFGTFAISVTAGHGAAGLHLLSPLTTALNYGQFEPDGSIDVRLVYDHRALDGAPVARALVELEETLHGPIRDELLSLAPRRIVREEADKPRLTRVVPR